jgi:hypothetical protein
LSYTADIHHWTKGNVDSFVDMFITHRDATGTE